MESLVGLFDSLLTLVVTFPTTIYYVLVSPEKLIGSNASIALSSPGTTLFIGFLIWYTANSLEIKLKYALDLPDLPSRSFFVRVALALIIALLFQYYYLVLIYFGSASDEEAIRIIRALSYPLSVFLTIYGVVYIIYILFPLGSRVHGFSIQERLDSNFRDVRCESRNKRIVIDEDASLFATIFGAVGYIYGLYQILREFFGMFQMTAILHTAGLIVVSMLLLIMFLYLAIERFSSLTDRLKSERESMPVKDP